MSTTAAGARFHWWLERSSAVALAPLSLWLLYTAARTDLTEVAAFAHWLQSTGNAVALGLFLVVSLYHSKLGLEVIVDDYISGSIWNRRVHLLCKLTLLLALAASLSAIVTLVM